MNLFIYIYLAINVLGLITLLVQGEMPKFLSGATLLSLVAFQFAYLPHTWALGTIFVLQFNTLLSEVVEEKVRVVAGVLALIAGILLLVQSSL